MEIHGGDIYRNHVNIDFSINVNPLGVPVCVKKALYKAVEKCEKYPDIKSQKLKEAISEFLEIPKEFILFGNGASELFMAIVHAIKPKKVVIPIPSFYGYEYAAKAAESEIIYYKMESCFTITEEIYSILTEEVDLLFLANPNNPTGNLLKKEMLENLLAHCQKKGIYVVIDECFIEFSKNAFSILSQIEKYDHLILIRAFTKIFAIPGVRLGYLISTNLFFLSEIAKQLPEWNVSCFAQEAGYFCTKQKKFILETQSYVKNEREFMEKELKNKKIQFFPSETNFMLIYDKEDLYQKLLKKGILIRDCKNFKGLNKGFYRIAIKSRRENKILLENL